MKIPIANGNQRRIRTAFVRHRHATVNHRILFTPFPLTLTLSLGEREQQVTLTIYSRAFGCISSAGCPPGRHAQNKAATICQPTGTDSPSPRGSGQG